MLGLGLSIPEIAIRGRRGFSPASLFANGEQGAWYDPADLSTLWQDSAGTTAVTAVEQPVGLMLDKSKGLVLGSDIETDDWSTPPSGVSYSAGTFTFDGVTSQSNVVFSTNTPSVPVVAGRTYQVSFTIFANTTAQVGVDVGGVLGDAQNAAGTYTRLITATSSTGPQARFRTSAGPRTGSMGNISVRELPGNHAFNPNATTVRPTLSARYNLLTYSEQFDNAAWIKGGLLAFGSGSTANATTAPDGTSTADLITESTANSTHEANQNVSAAALTAYTVSAYFKRTAATRDAYIQVNNNGSGTGGAIAGIFDLAAVSASVSTLVAGFTAVSASITNVGNGWYRCAVNLTTVAGTTSLTAYNGIYNGARSYIGDGTSGIYIWGADLRVANESATIPYQRVVTATDYDADPTKFPYYLRNVADDWLQTAAIDFSATDSVSVFAGLRKLSDGARGTVVELTTSADSNNGAFHLTAPNAASATIAFESKGTTLADAVASSNVAAPITVVATGLADISTPSNVLRINGVQADTDGGSQGTGNYANAAMYIGRRAGSSLPFDGRLYSLVVLGRTATADEIASAETYVASRSGVTL